MKVSRWKGFGETEVVLSRLFRAKLVLALGTIARLIWCFNIHVSTVPDFQSSRVSLSPCGVGSLELSCSRSKLQIISAGYLLAPGTFSSLALHLCR